LFKSKWLNASVLCIGSKYRDGTQVEFGLLLIPLWGVNGGSYRGNYYRGRLFSKTGGKEKLWNEKWMVQEKLQQLAKIIKSALFEDIHSAVLICKKKCLKKKNHRYETKLAYQTAEHYGFIKHKQVNKTCLFAAQDRWNPTDEEHFLSPVKSSKNSNCQKDVGD